MKIKNLLLAGLAVFAMSGCSSENDAIVDNGENATEKNATMRFSIGFPSTVTRATADEIGTTEEQAVQNITAVLVYANGSPIQVLNFEKSELTQEEAKVTTASKEVYAGNGDIFVYINPITPITASNYSSATESAKYTNTLDGLADNIAKASNFLMSGKNTFTAVAGKSDNTAFVTVSRVAAKIAEGSQKSFTNVSDRGLKLNFTLMSYAFTNLNKVSNVLEGSIFTPTTTDGYFQYFKRTNAALKTFEDLTATKVIGTEATNITYCLENDNNTAITQVLYKAQAIVDGSQAANLYVVTKGDRTGLYKNFDALNAAYGGQLTTDAYGNLSDASNYTAFNTYGIKKYENGICYYAQDIKTNVGENTGSKILRNNFYKLTVNSIKGLGEPGIDTPTPGDPITMLDLEITVKNWTVNENGFDLQ